LFNMPVKEQSPMRGKPDRVSRRPEGNMDVVCQEPAVKDCG
jgi:hypothetical protein